MRPTLRYCLRLVCRNSRFGSRRRAIPGRRRAVLIVPLLVMPLHGQHGEDEDKDAEDDPLHEAHEELEAIQGNWDESEGDRGHYGKGKLAAVDVAEESHRQGDRLHDFKEELQHANEEADWTALEREELSEIATDAERANALVVEVDEGDECQANRDVHVARWRAELVHSTNAWNQA